MALRVLHLVKGLGPGGAERLIVSLTQARGPDLEVHVGYLLPAKAHLVGELEGAGAQVHLLAGPRGLADLRWPVRLSRLIGVVEPDIVHVHSPAMAAVVRPLVRARRGRPGLVSTEHNLWGSFSPITRALNGATVPLDDLTLAVSEEVRRSAWRRLQGRTRVLQHGIPVDRLSARSRERESARVELGVADDAVVVATIANFREKKDYPTLLAAAEAAVADEPRLRFVSVGQGPLEDALKDLHGRTALGDRFRFLGYRADPARVLAAADVFTLTSRYEGLPVALLEALALGLPAVVSRVGGIPDVVREDVEGTLIGAGDVAGFTAAYVLLARDEGRRQRLGRGAATRARAFDIARTAEMLEELYQAVARR